MKSAPRRSAAAQRKRGPTRIVFAAVATLGSLLLLEGVAGLAPTGWGGTKAEVVRDVLGEASAMVASGDVPGWDIDQQQQTATGVPFTVDAWKMRGPDADPYPAVAGPDARRVIFVGDSSIFGFGLPWDETFSARYAALREAKAPGLDYQTANCAVPGHSSFQSIHKLQKHCLAFAPDLVVIGNMNSDSTLAWVEDEVSLDLSRDAGSALDRSALYRLARNSWLRLVVMKGVQPRTIAQHGRTDASMPVGNTQRVPVDAYERNLRRLVELARAGGAQAAFLLLPTRYDVEHPSHPSQADAYRAVMRALAAELDVPLADAAVAFKTLSSPNELFFDPVHPTAAGAARIAEVLDASLPPETARAR
ncbi:MAG: SGNH/GDSL hydrolase family protein [Myxococcota bacterium]